MAKKRSFNNGFTKPGLVLAIRLFTLIAMAVSVYLAYVSTTGGAAVGCGPDSGCDKVLRSRWAYWFGAPVSLFALIVYSLILGASFRLSRRSHPLEQRKAWAWLVPCAIVVAGAAIWFVGLQVFAVRAFCPYCMVAHGSGFVAAVLLLIAAPMRDPRGKPWEMEGHVFVAPRIFKRVAIIAGAALAMLVVGQVVHQPPTSVVKSIAEVVNAPQSTPPVAGAIPKVVPKPEIVSAPPGPKVPVPGSRLFPLYGGRFQLELHKVPVIGSPTNPQVVVSLFDYTCHHCRAMHPLLVEAQKIFSNSLAIVSLPMPLDPGCNPTMQRPNPKHTNACQYARLGLAVWRADRSKHPAFDDWLMAGATPPPFADAVQRATETVGAAALEKAARDPWVEEQLKLDVAMYELAYRAGQGSMPQLILGTNVAVGSYLRDDLIKLLVSNLGLKTRP
jgi:uncharacterized membrane protein